MTTYYVDATDGDDGNTGTSIGQEWQTVSKVSSEFVAGTFGPGDSILFKRGETWTFSSWSGLTVKNCSGTCGNHIYIGAYGEGNRPVLDGDGTVTPLIVHVLSDANGDYITVEGLELTGNYDAPAVQIKGVRNWTFEDCYIHDITMEPEGYCSGITANDASEYIWINNCTFENIQGESIYLGSYNVPTDTTRMVWVSNCTITNPGWDGIDIKEYTRDIFIWNCDFVTEQGESTNYHILCGGERHKIYNCTFDGEPNYAQVVLGAYREYANGDSHHLERCLFKNAGSPTWGAIRVLSTNQTIVNCTIEGANYGIYEGNDESGRVVRNCIFTNCTYGMLVNNNGNWDCNYNLYNEASDIWYYSGAGRDLAYVQGTLSQEANGDDSAANFAETTNYTLSATSNAINGGDASATHYDWNDFYNASGTPDMGWQEYEPPWQEGYPGNTHRIFVSAFHESSAFTKWSGSSGVTTTTTPTPEAGDYCMHVQPANGTDKYAYRESLGNLGHLHLSLYINIDSLTMANGDLFNIVELKNSSDTDILVVQIYDNSGTTQLRVGVLDDTPSWNYTSYYDLSSGWQLIDVFWFAAPDVSYNEGDVMLRIESEEKEQIEDLNNHDEMIDKFYLGAFDVDVGTTDDLFFDAVELDWIRCMGEYSETLITPITETVTVMT